MTAEDLSARKRQQVYTGPPTPPSGTAQSILTPASMSSAFNMNQPPNHLSPIPFALNFPLQQPNHARAPPLAGTLLDVLPDDNDNVMNWLWMLDGMESSDVLLSPEGLDSNYDSSSTHTPSEQIHVKEEDAEDNTPTLFIRSEENMKKTHERLTMRGVTGVWSMEEMRDVQMKVKRLREFVTPEQRASMKSDFESGLESFRYISNTVSVPTVVWDRTAVVHHANQSFAEATGFCMETPTRREQMVTIEMSSPDTLVAINSLMKREMQPRLTDPSMPMDAEVTVWNVNNKNLPLYKTSVINGRLYLVGQMYVTTKRDIFGLPLLFMSHFFPYPAGHNSNAVPQSAPRAGLSSLEILLAEGKISQEVFLQMIQQQEEKQKRDNSIRVLKDRLKDAGHTEEQRRAYQKKLDELEIGLQ
ncbi:hypothetical protein PROFUN_11799 [Planoprotostelium fungivorum]|uniref:PAS domain-containing protein n=1 Tax=Planoprotostelium fungivorum TaxID=1890364 RepID=A0A2P6MRG7_9EUKA|nr:hypothetical protein PROFUN_11799 [Planoprotostelium fungivorum]